MATNNDSRAITANRLFVYLLLIAGRLREVRAVAPEDAPQRRREGERVEGGALEEVVRHPRHRPHRR
eukprot:3506275-Pyramimonas_sp.AAC.1